MAGIVGHKMHVFAIPGHFYGEYPDGGTLGYELSLRGPAPKAEKEPNFVFHSLIYLSQPSRKRQQYSSACSGEREKRFSSF